MWHCLQAPPASVWAWTAQWPPNGSLLATVAHMLCECEVGWCLSLEPVCHLPVITKLASAHGLHQAHKPAQCAGPQVGQGQARPGRRAELNTCKSDEGKLGPLESRVRASSDSSKPQKSSFANLAYLKPA